MGCLQWNDTSVSHGPALGSGKADEASGVLGRCCPGRAQATVTLGPETRNDGKSPWPTADEPPGYSRKQNCSLRSTPLFSQITESQVDLNKMMHEPSAFRL